MRLLCVPALHLHGNQRLEENTKKILNTFINRVNGSSPHKSKGVHMNYIEVVEDLLTFSIPPEDMDSVDGNSVREFARLNVQKYKNTLRILRCSNHICYASNMNTVLQSFGCPNCDTFFKRTFKLD